MGATSISSLNSYALPSDMLIYVDPNQLGDWCANGPGATARITPSALLTNTVLLTSLQAASGEFESAVIRGKKYMPSDFVYNATTGQGLQGVDLQHLVRLVCNLAKFILWSRKSRKSKEDAIPPGCLEAKEEIARLGDGECIFAFLETYDAAGVEAVSNVTGQPVTLVPVVPLPERAHGFFGNRLTGRGYFFPGGW